MPKTIEELHRDAQQGNLSRNDVTIYLTRGWITDSEAEELDNLISERSHNWIAVIASALAGGMVGLLGVVALRAAFAGGDVATCALPVLPLVGIVAGILFARRARNIFGLRIGIAGVTLIALLVSCGSCALINTISGIEMDAKFARMGIEPDPLPTTLVWAQRIFVALLVIVAFVVVTIIVRRRQRQQP